MEKKTARNFFIWGTVICTAIFIWLTIDTHKTIPERTNTDKLTDEVVAGKRVWHKYNCNGCHTILGIGVYYSPDVTKVYSKRGDIWLKEYLKNPESPDPKRRKMPNQNLSADEITKVIAFLQWVSEIDTNDWPPTPITVAKVTGAPLEETAMILKGKTVYTQNRCDLCHRIGGQGGVIGPDLSRVGTAKDPQRLSQIIKDPKSVNPNTQMPAYPHLADDEVQALVSFLAGLK